MNHALPNFVYLNSYKEAMMNTKPQASSLLLNLSLLKKESFKKVIDLTLGYLKALSTEKSWGSFAKVEKMSWEFSTLQNYTVISEHTEFANHYQKMCR